MEPSHRLIKTLTGLAVAMMSTTALLGWINPASSLPASHQSLETLRDIARFAVLDGVDRISDRWNEVALRPAPAGPGNLLAATTSPADPHFHVDAEGHAAQTHRWRRQLGDRVAPRTISIEIQPTNAGERLSTAQTATVHAIMDAVGESRPAALPPLRLVDDLASGVPEKQRSLPSRGL